jgi:hypothetical protein
VALTLVRIGGALTLVALGAFFWFERRRVRLKPDSTGTDGSVRLPPSREASADRRSFGGGG